MTRQMDTEALINALANQPAPAPLDKPKTLTVVLAAITLGVVAVLSIVGLRIDLIEALTTPLTLSKNLLPLALAAIALTLAFQSTRPEARPRAALLWLPAGMAFALYIWAFLVTPSEALGMAIRGKTIGACLISITSISAVPLILGIALVRRGATTKPALTGALLGLAIGGFAAAGYALHCNEDSPLFFVTWYGLGIVLCGVAGAIGGRAFLRW